MYSVAGDYDYLELITNSKSGSFFFYSHDQKYIIKNMKVSIHPAEDERRIHAVPELGSSHRLEKTGYDPDSNTRLNPLRQRPGFVERASFRRDTACCYFCYTPKNSAGRLVASVNFHSVL